MSGICASLRLDGQPALAEALGPVMAQLAERGPDRSAVLADGPVALGHALLATTPEALVEAMPWRHADSGCVITADVRLDNRDDLIAALAPDLAQRVIGDGELIALAYLAWGTDCLDHLLGDFAFVLWDPRSQRLFAARDQVGMRQLAYHHAPGKLFAAATDAHALLCHPDVPHRVNRARVADFLEQLEAIDYVTTWFDGLVRLPPAHALVVDDTGLRVWRYWELTAHALPSGWTDADYAAAFLETFTEAVRVRLRAPEGALGAMLSGGMDSGSVAAIAARLLAEAGAPSLVTFSGVDVLPDCKESACIRDAAAHIPHLDPQMVSIAEVDAFRDDLLRLTRNESDPFDGHMVLIRAIYIAAHRAGIKVMLDGVSGDTTLGTGDIIAYNVAKGRWRAAWDEAWLLERIWGRKEAPAATAFGRAVWRRFCPQWIRARRDRAWQAREADLAARQSIVSDSLAARVDMPARRRAFARHVAVGQGWGADTQARRMLHPFAIAGRERYDRVAGALGIEPRDPFLDVRLLKLAVSLPVDQLHAGGWPKLILRRAMAGLLPDSVRWKQGRDHVGWRFIDEFLGNPLNFQGYDLPAELCKPADTTAEGEQFALHCNTDGLVSKRDLFYLNSWITRFKSIWD